jgi:hypothetical protein
MMVPMPSDTAHFKVLYGLWHGRVKADSKKQNGYGDKNRPMVYIQNSIYSILISESFTAFTLPPVEILRERIQCVFVHIAFTNTLYNGNFRLSTNFY